MVFSINVNNQCKTLIVCKMTITFQTLIYYHVELTSVDCIYANGIRVESYNNENFKERVD